MKIQITDLNTLTEDKLIHVGRKLERYEAVVRVRDVEYGAFGKTRQLALKKLVKHLENSMIRYQRMANALDIAADRVNTKATRGK